MELITIAKPYANAIFAIAEQDKSYSDWKEVLEAGSQLVEDQQMQAFIASPSVAKQEKSSAIIDLLKSILGRDLSSNENSLIDLLLANSRVGVLPSIAQLFEQLMNTTADAKAFNVISAYKLSAAEEKKITSDLADKYKVSVSIDTEIDESLVGGVIIKEGDKVIDMSIKARVDGLNLCLS